METEGGENEKNMDKVDDSEAEWSDYNSNDEGDGRNTGEPQKKKVKASDMECRLNRYHPTHDECDDYLVWRAVKRNRPDVLQRLIEERKPIRINNVGRTALNYAATLGNTECLRILLNEGTCDIDSKDNFGYTPLMDACENSWKLSNSTDCVEVLCEYKADHRVINERGLTALFMVVHGVHGHIHGKPDPKVVKQLVSSGADIEIDKGVVPTTIPEYKSLVGSLYTKKSWSGTYVLKDIESEVNFGAIVGSIRVLMFQGLVSGTVPLTAVKDMHRILKLKMRERLPIDFMPVNKLYTMAQNPPSLSQLARTKIRRQMTECGGGSFCREDFQKLEIPESLKDSVQLAGLGDGSKVLEVMIGIEEMMENIKQGDGSRGDDDDGNDDDEDDDNEEAAWEAALDAYWEDMGWE